MAFAFVKHKNSFFAISIRHKSSVITLVGDNPIPALKLFWFWFRLRNAPGDDIMLETMSLIAVKTFVFKCFSTIFFVELKPLSGKTAIIPNTGIAIIKHDFNIVVVIGESGVPAFRDNRFRSGDVTPCQDFGSWNKMSLLS